MNEEIQTGTEIAKGIGEAAKEVALNLLGPPTTEMGLFAGDLIANWRMQNLVNTYEKIRAKYPNKQLPKEALERLPFGFRALFVEEVSKVENDELQNLWANLLKNSILQGPEDDSTTCLNYLKTLSPNMALAFKALSLQSKKDEYLENKPYAIELAKRTDEEITSCLERLHDVSLATFYRRQISDIKNIKPKNDLRPNAAASANALQRLMTEVNLNQAHPFVKTHESFFRDKTAENDNAIFIDMTLTALGKSLAAKVKS